MNNYIIDPAVFYWMSVLGGLKVLLGVFGSMFTLAGFIFLGCYLYHRHESENEVNSNSYRESQERPAKMCKKWCKIFLSFGILFIFICVFMPSKAVCIEMLVAKTATFDNVNWTVDQLKEVVDYIVSAMKGA